MTDSDPGLVHDDPPFQPVAVVLAALFPGAGHAFLGESRRALLICCGVLGLFFGGILVGGVDVVDKKEDGIWFLGEALVGPLAFGINSFHQNNLKVSDREGGPKRSAAPYEIRNPNNGVAITVRHPESGKPAEFPDPRLGGAIRLSNDGDQPPNSKSVGRVNELGTLICAIAGMLNLICIIDAAFRHKVKKSPKPAPDAPQGAAA